MSRKNEWIIRLVNAQSNQSEDFLLDTEIDEMNEINDLRKIILETQEEAFVSSTST